MNLLLLAHHVDLSDYPVLAIIFGAGFWIGWDAIAKLMAPKRLNPDEAAGPHG
jgi:hypothetical protein